MTAKIKTIHLLLLEPSSNQAEVIINSLRNRGFAVRATQVLTTEELSTALEKGVSDLLIADLEHQELSAKQAIEQIDSFGRDIPCIVMMNEHSDDILIECMRYGAVDGVTKANLDLLCLKVERELASLETRRGKTQSDLQLKATEKRCTLLLDNSQDAIAYVHDGMHVYANNAYLELFEYSDHDELLCVPALDMIAKESQDEFRQYLKSISATSDQQNFSFTGTKSDLSHFEAIMTLSTANYDDEVCTQLLIRPAADNAELEEKLKELSAQDTLTDLYNKNYFTDQLQHAIESANDQAETYSVLYITYDQHEQILGEYGIAGADQITVDCSKWLSEQVKEEFLLARIGDHSFSMLLPNSAGIKSRDMAQELCEKVSSHLFDIEGHTIKITFSIGICPVGDSSSDPAQILSDAISASARVDNGNGFKVFNKAVRAAGSEQDVQMLDKVQEAIESGRIQLMYQPIVKLHGEEKLLYQVLLRLSDEKGNMLESSKVFPVAKAAGLGEKLDRWIIKQSLKSILTQKVDKKTQLFVNLSSVSLIDKNIVNFIEKTITASGLPKESIVFQIEEGDAVNHLKRVIALCAELRSKGFALCLSNFGAQPDQKTLVDQLDVNFVKVADEKVKSLHTDSESAEFVQELLNEIHNRDKHSIIPKVEEAAMLAALWPLNVKYIQGYYLQRPSLKMDYDFASGGF
ncbi:EAL domain-containing protein [Aliikangiella marina]|uniref:EAL domain-containing protein n=1 Tax=Aliikangiella marina TaxID=1712262 RepID=A0A545T740_9GAMM|nr:EAL domain-containing protein [Aliikangiella marina]TQV73041.1 EAL domain-containing protein [Aliikangiella marina]